MAQQPNEDRKVDFSNLPRGAISLKGLPVSRNTRLPSIRTPRDLTLGAQPKRTFMPNIPVRREKKQSQPENASASYEECGSRPEKKAILLSDRGRGRGRGRGQIIQTQGSVFSEGIAAESSVQKDKKRESYQKSESTSSAISIKREKVETTVTSISNQLNSLLRDDFIDDGDDDDVMILTKPTIFPSGAQVKKELKVEATANTNFDPSVAAELGYDIKNVAKFIKKEKGTETIDKMETSPVKEFQNPINGLLEAGDTKLLLLEFPQNVFTQFEDIDSDSQQKKQADSESQSSPASFDPPNVSNLLDGHIGKLQLYKSGKVRLLLGSLSLELGSTNQLHTRHEAVCVKTSDTSGDLTVLGSIESKLNFSSYIDNLI